MAQSFYLIQSGKDAKVETTFVPSLELEGSYEIALQSLETYYSFPNVDEKITRFESLLMELHGMISLLLLGVTSTKI